MIAVTAANVKASADGELWKCHTTSGVCVFLRPGVSDSYKTGWSHTLDTLWGTQAHDQKGDSFPGQPDTNSQTRQVFDRYQDYAILARSIGDLQFDILGGLREIYIPPEFKWLASTRQVIWSDANGIYHVRFFNLGAPDIAGLYFFKISGIDEGNYPIIIVKDELNPAWVEATVQTQNVPGPSVSGIVTATGTTLEGRSVTGRAYWGPVEFVGNNSVPPGPAGALYRTFLFGLPAGTYQVRAEALGFSAAMKEDLVFDAGQSYHLRLAVFTPPTSPQTTTVISTITASTTTTTTATLTPSSCGGPFGIGVPIRGTVYWYDQYGSLRTFPWARVTATSRSSGIMATSSTIDGTYILCLPPGIYDVIVTSDPGLVSQTKMVAFSPGSLDIAGVDFQLQSSGKPIPEDLSDVMFERIESAERPPQTMERERQD